MYKYKYILISIYMIQTISLTPCQNLYCQNISTYIKNIKNINLYYIKILSALSFSSSLLFSPHFYCLLIILKSSVTIVMSSLPHLWVYLKIRYEEYSSYCLLQSHIVFTFHRAFEYSGVADSFFKPHIHSFPSNLLF